MFSNVQLYCHLEIEIKSNRLADEPVYVSSRLDSSQDINDEKIIQNHLETWDINLMQYTMINIRLAEVYVCVW